MKESLISGFLGAVCSGSFGAIFAAKIKQKSDLKLQAKEHEYQKNMKLLESLESLVRETHENPSSASFSRSKVEEIISLLERLKEDWSSEDSYNYASASLWLRNSGNLLIEDTIEYVKTKNASFREYTREDENYLTNFRKGISGYMHWLLKKLENNGRSAIKPRLGPNHGKASSIPPSYYRSAFEFMEAKVSKVPSENILPEICPDRFLKFIVSNISLISGELKYQPLGVKESVLIRTFLRELIDIL